MYYSLLIAALLPVAALCYFIYKKDVNKEPKQLLQKLFGFGCLTVIPIIFFELFLGGFFPTEEVYDFLTLFINVFISVGLVEEGFKWITVKKIGYDNHEFDEIYDIIVYSVFVSLGFACVENVLYVLDNGFYTAFLRAVTAVPGHTCFAVFMGYFLSKAKVNEINNNHDLAVKNMLLSLFIPVSIHTIYDTVLIYASAIKSDSFVYLFFLFIIVMFCIAFFIVNRISEVQSNITQNVKSGNISYEKGNVSMNTAQINLETLQQAGNATPQTSKSLQQAVIPNYCPICGKPTSGANYCGFCGYKLKQ